MDLNLSWRISMSYVACAGWWPVSVVGLRVLGDRANAPFRTGERSPNLTNLSLPSAVRLRLVRRDFKRLRESWGIANKRWQAAVRPPQRAEHRDRPRSRRAWDGPQAAISRPCSTASAVSSLRSCDQPALTVADEPWPHCRRWMAGMTGSLEPHALLIGRGIPLAARSCTVHGHRPNRVARRR
jgi:hypothetical protein